MADEARFSQWIAIVVGDAPAEFDLLPGAAAVGSGAPGPQLVITLNPPPAAAMLVPLVVSGGAVGHHPDPSVLAISAPAVTLVHGEPPPEPVPTCTGAHIPAYLAMLQQLLPRGAAWTRERDAVLTRLLEGFSCELSCIEERGEALLAESDPRTSVEMLLDWEETAGLPDPCSPDPVGVSRRRAALLERLTNRGGASPQYFEAVALALGFEIEVLEFQPFVAGSDAGASLTNTQEPFVAGSNAGDWLTNNTDWAFTWAVLAPVDSVVYFSAGQSSAGDPLAEWGNAILECVLRELAPAHTNLLFFYQRVLKPGPAGVTLVPATVSLS